VFTLAGVALCMFCLSPFVDAALAEQQALSGPASAIRELQALAKNRSAADASPATDSLVSNTNPLALSAANSTAGTASHSTLVPAGMVRIPGDAPVGLPASTPGLHAAVASGRSARQSLTVTVVLKRTNQTGFARYLKQVYNRRSPLYRHYLTQAQLANRFGPSRREYNRVRSWLRADGFAVTQGSANRLSISARVTEAKAERAFDTPIETFKTARSEVYSNTAAPAVPRSLAGDVRAVIGLSDRDPPAAPQTNLTDYLDSLSPCLGKVISIFLPNDLPVALEAGWLFFLFLAPEAVLLGAFLEGLALGASAAYNVNNFVQYYNCLMDYANSQGGSSGSGGGGSFAADLQHSHSLSPSLNRHAPPGRESHIVGDPVKLGLLEFDTYRSSDVSDWLNLAKANTAAFSDLTERPVNGGVATPGAGQSEVLLDIDTVLDLANNTSPPQVVVYDAPPSTSFAQMFQAMIADGDTVISNSWTQCEDQTPLADAQAIDSILANAAASGVTVVNGSGDSGSSCLDGTPNTVGVPADSPNATAVGGTTPTWGNALNVVSQSYWNGATETPATGQGGFGVSRYFARPAYQNGVTSSSGRSVPDVAVVADPNDGLQLCEADAGGCPDGSVYGGTSMAAPEMGIEVAQLDQALGSPVGNFNAATYPLENDPDTFTTASQMGTDTAHVGLGAPNFERIYEALKGVTPGPVSASISTVATTPAPADTATDAIVRVQLLDSGGLSLPGKTVTVSVPSGTVQFASNTAVTDSQGVATFTATDTTPESTPVTVTDTSDGNVVLSMTPNLTFTQPAAVGATIVASPTTVADDGLAQTTITVYLQNAMGRPAGGKTVSLSDNGANASISPSLQVVTGSDGEATFTATDTTQEAVSFTATDVSDGSLPVPGSASVNFAPSGSSPNCDPTLPTGSGGFSVSPFASGLGADQQAEVTFTGGITFTTPACDGGETPAFDSSGNVYVPDDIDGRIYRFGPSGGSASPAVALPDTSFMPNGQLDSIAFGKNGELWASLNESGNNVTQPELVQLDPSTGATLRVVATRAEGFTYCPQYNMAVDPLTGDVFAGDDCGGALESSAIVRVHDPDSSSPTVSNYITEGGPVVGLTFAPDGTMYDVACSSNGCEQIDAVSATNHMGTPTITALATLPNSAVGIAVAATDSQGHATALEVADNSGNVYRIDLAQTPPITPTLIASGGGGTTGAGENQPVGVGPDGCLYVARADAVYKVTGAGCSQANAGPEITLQQSSGTATPPTGSPVGFTATLDNVASPSGTPVHFSVNGTNITTQLIDASSTGQATASYDGIHQGVDAISAWTVVNGKLITSAPIQVHWTAGLDTTFLDLNQSQEGGPVGSPATVSASLLDGAQSPAVPLAGQTVTLDVGGQSCSAQTNVAGVASCQITPQTAGLQQVTASYAGSSQYTPAQATNSFDAFVGTASPPGGGTAGGSTPAATCPKPSGRLRANTLGPLKLGFTRAHARRTLKRYTTRHDADSFCIAPGHVIRAGYPTTTLLHSLPKRERKQLGGKVILLLTNAAFYKLDGIKPGTKLTKKLRRRLHTLEAFHADGATWYVVPGKQSDGFLKIVGNVVQEVGIGDRQLLLTHPATQRFLVSFKSSRP
jgi:hypothetical protein